MIGKGVRLRTLGFLFWLSLGILLPLLVPSESVHEVIDVEARAVAHFVGRQTHGVHNTDMITTVVTVMIVILVEPCSAGSSV